MIRKITLAFLAAVASLIVLCVVAVVIVRRPTPPTFRQASPDRPPRLPCDEAAHFDVQSEWWYYSGFLTTAAGREYGFELVFFKVFIPSQARIAGLLPVNLLGNPLYPAHFAVSDLTAREHTFAERVNFPQFWAAGAAEDRYRVWNGDWQAEGEWTMRGDPPTCSGGKAHHLQASSERYTLDLVLAPTKPAALHGPDGRGVVQMGEAGTSFYYSYPEMKGDGFLWVDGRAQTVTASAWMDHQWGSWQAHGGYAGWDWFSLRLDDGVQVMLFDFRDGAGGIQAGSGGTWIAADGSTTPLTMDDYALEVLDRWTSPTSGATYPVRWRVTVPAHGLDVTVEAIFPEQELTTELGPVYWEGAVIVRGSATGKGFVEMTGYNPQTRSAGP